MSDKTQYGSHLISDYYICTVCGTKDRLDGLLRNEEGKYVCKNANFCKRAFYAQRKRDK